MHFGAKPRVGLAWLQGEGLGPRFCILALRPAAAAEARGAALSEHAEKEHAGDDQQKEKHVGFCGLVVA